MIKGIRTAVRYAYRVPILGYVLSLLVGIFALPRTRESVRALTKVATDQRIALRRAIKANDTAIALKRHLPAFMTAISSVNALAFQVAKTDAALLALEAKVDAAIGQVNRDLPPPTTEILSSEKLNARPLKLNLGGGREPLAGYVNIDVRRLEGVDIVAPADGLPFNADSVDEVRCTHFLERFEPHELETVLLPSWVRLLKVGGRFSAIVLDADALIRSYAQGDCTFEEFREAFFGGPGDQASGPLHMLTPEGLEKTMRAAGLVQTAVVAKGRSGDKGLEFEITGIRA
jgi:hypothetical protein